MVSGFSQNFLGRLLNRLYRFYYRRLYRLWCRLYWLYRMGQRSDRIKGTSSSEILYLILGIVWMPVVLIAGLFSKDQKERLSAGYIYVGLRILQVIPFSQIEKGF